MLSRLSTTLLIATLLALVPSAASAEAGDGLISGNLRLSPGATVAGTYDNNVFRLSTQERTPLGSPKVQLTPFLEINTIEVDTVDFRLNGEVTWDQYLSGSSITQGQSGLSALLGADLAFNRGGAVSFQLQDRFQRTNEPPPSPADFAYNRTLNRVGATVGLHPGGQVFQHYLSYDWTLYRHDDLPDLNRQMHDITLRNHWRFLPRTAFVLAGDYSIIRYDTLSRQGTEFQNVNSNPLRVSGGISGLITKRLSLRLTGGWGWGFYEGDAGTFSGLVVDTQLAYAFGVEPDGNRIFVGYERNFQDATIATFATYDRPYAGYAQRFFDERLSLNVRADVMIRDYVGAPAGRFTVGEADVVIGGNLEDLLVKVTGGVSYKVRNWWSVYGQYSFNTNFTNDSIAIVGGDEVVREYQQHIITIGTTVRY